MSDASQSVAATIDTPYVGPVRGSERYSSVDVVRGVALLGILLMNITVFGHALGWWDVINNPSGVNFWIWVTEFTLFEGTQRTLFSLLFGAGVIILTSRAEARGAGLITADIYYRRNLWLIAFGMIDGYLLLWYGDILFYYGLAALFLFPLRNLSVRSLFAAGLACLLVLVAVRFDDASDTWTMKDEFVAASEAKAAGAELDEEQKGAMKAWEQHLNEGKFDQEKIDKRIEKRQGSYFEIMKEFSATLTKLHGYINYRYLFLDVLSIMLVGMALMKAGVLTLEKSTRFYWLLMLIGYGIGLPVSLWETKTLVLNDFSPVITEHVFLTYDLGRLANGTGHLGLILLFVQSGKWRWMQDRLAAVGRMALTNYIMHSVICGIVFLGPGFGLYGFYERYQLYYIVLAIWLFQLLVSIHWLDRYRFGPLEWLWRSLTYLEKQPMRR